MQHVQPDTQAHFAHQFRAHSLREIEGGLKRCESKLAHLGIEAPARSSLSYANGHRPWELFEKVSMLLLRYLQLPSRFGWSRANLVALLRMNLFTHRHLMAWLDEPFATPPDPHDNPQAALAVMRSSA